MATCIKAKLNLSKLDKTAFFKGETGVLCDVNIWINDTPDQYGNDASLQQDLGRDRRLAGEKGPYFGNGKKLVPASQGGQAQARPAPQQTAPVAADQAPEDCVPF